MFNVSYQHSDLSHIEVSDQELRDLRGALHYMREKAREHEAYYSNICNFSKGIKIIERILD